MAGGMYNVHYKSTFDGVITRVNFWILKVSLVSCLYLLYKAEKPSVCPSVRIFLAVWISAMAARIDIGRARNDSYVFWRDEVYF